MPFASPPSAESASSVLEDLLDEPAAHETPAPPASFPSSHSNSPSPARTASALPPTTPFVADVVDTQHPHNPGRVLIAWSGGQAWLPVLRGLSLRPTDRVMVVPVSGLPEPVITGVIDGLGVRPEPPRTARAALVLKPDETVRIESQSGAPLLEVFEKDGAPVVRLSSRDMAIEVPGALTVTADKIALSARSGDVRVEAGDSVILRGEDIRLN